MNRKSDNCIMLFVKYPYSGLVKTRLGEQTSAEFATEVYKRFVGDILSTVRDVEADLRIFFCPTWSDEEFVLWLGQGYRYVPQIGSDLGQRMRNAFEHVFAEGYSRAVLIGSDSPDLPAGYIRSAFRTLESYDAVVGPANDGGYYLLGFSKTTFLPDVFESIVWSTPFVYIKTLDILRKNSQRIYLLPQWNDVDTLADLRGLVLRNRETLFRWSETMQFVLNSYTVPEAASFIWSGDDV